jgi:hypothetical protein
MTFREWLSSADPEIKQLTAAIFPIAQKKDNSIKIDDLEKAIDCYLSNRIDLRRVKRKLWDGVKAHQFGLSSSTGYNLINHILSYARNDPEKNCDAFFPKLPQVLQQNRKDIIASLSGS